MATLLVDEQDGHLVIDEQDGIVAITTLPLLATTPPWLLVSEVEDDRLQTGEQQLQHD